MKLHLIQPDDNEAVPMTPARERLAHLLKAKADAAAEVAEAQARVDRLRALATGSSPIEAKLAALDAEEAPRFSLWAKAKPRLPPPAADTKTRTDLLRELSDAKAAGEAQPPEPSAGMSHETADANAKAAAVDPAIPLAAALVGLEELGPIAEEARAAVRLVAELRMKGHAILDALL